MQTRKRSEREFSVGDLVYLRIKHSHQKSFSHSKLCPKYFGSFPIIANVGPVAYHLQLPPDTNMHPVFHVSLLKKTIGSTAQSSPTLPPLTTDGDFKVEPSVILDKRVIYRNNLPLTQVLVKWSHLHLDNNTWEYLPHLLTQFPCAAQLLCFS